MMFRSRKGIIFVSLLAIIVVVMMLTGALIKVSQLGLYQAAHYRDQVLAVQAAKGGANHLIRLLELDSAYESSLEVALQREGYSATFDTSQPDYSVNNLSSANPSATPSSVGRQVAPFSADLVLTGRSGSATARVHVIVVPGFSSGRSVAALGRVSLDGDIVVDGVKSLIADPSGGTALLEAPGGIFSKYRSTGPNDPAISWTGSSGSDFSLSSLSRLEAAPPETGGQAIGSNLRAQFPGKTIDNAAADTIPDFDVAARVQAASSYPPPDSLVAGQLNGYSFIKDSRRVSGDLKVNGDIVLSDGTLYVDGDLVVDGGIKGMGAVYVSGNVTLRGGNTLVQVGQPSGAALMAGGDIDLQGLDARGYLASLASSNSDVALALDRLEQDLEKYRDVTDYDDFNLLSLRISKQDTSLAHGNPWIGPIPGPSGTHNKSQETGSIPSLLNKIKISLPAHASIPKAVKVISALEEMQFHFRHNYYNFPSLRTSSGVEAYRLDDFYVPTDLGTGTVLDNSGVGAAGAISSNNWDDSSYPRKFWTHDHLYVPGMIPQHHFARRDAYLEQNPLDFSWLGDSSFQGLVYARGNIKASNRFKVVGSLVSQGDVALTQGAKLTFNEDYRHLFGRDLPIGLVFYEEL